MNRINCDQCGARYVGLCSCPKTLRVTSGDHKVKIIWMHGCFTAVSADEASAVSESQAKYLKSWPHSNYTFTPANRDAVDDCVGACFVMPVCVARGRRKKPFGRDSMDNGLCDGDCPGYAQELVGRRRLRGRETGSGKVYGLPIGRTSRSGWHY